MFNFTKVRSPQSPTYMQLMEVRLYDASNSAIVVANAAAPFNPARYGAGRESPDKAADGCLSGCPNWFVYDFETVGFAALVLSLSSAQQVAGYGLMTANDNPSRDPVSWMFWRLLDT
eukprot:3849097-Prymnesium_polylepis.1